jgi:hypothetical protein
MPIIPRAPADALVCTTELFLKRFLMLLDEWFQYYLLNLDIYLKNNPETHHKICHEMLHYRNYTTVLTTFTLIQPRGSSRNPGE